MKNKYQSKINKFISQITNEGVLFWAEKLQKEFPRAEIYLVGGAVRDVLLNIPTKDYDFVVRKVSARKLQNFLETNGWVELLGKNFGVFKFLPHKSTQMRTSSSVPQKSGTTADRQINTNINPIDIALPRTEHSILKSGAYRDFKVQSDHRLTIEEDLGRRDFTVNAMALKIQEYKNIKIKKQNKFNFELIDKFNGLSDLENKIIRTVGNPNKRFKEDYSRMPRAIRFACQLNFTIEKKTKSSIKKLIKNLNNVETRCHSLSSGQTRLVSTQSIKDYIIPREIIAKEFLRALVENPIRAFDLFDELGIFKVLMPEILKMKGCQQPKNYHTEGDVWQHTRLCLQMLDSKLFANQFKKNITTPVGTMHCILQHEETTPRYYPHKTRLYNVPLRTRQCSLSTGQTSLVPTKINQKPYDSEVVLAVLLHDIEKPSCAGWIEKNGEKRLQFYGHDTEGAKTAKKICDRLRLSTPKELGVDCHNLAWLIKKHILLIHGKIDKMKPTKLEKYFLSDKHPGEKLLKLTYADAISTIQAGRKIPEKKSDLKDWIALQGFKIALKRIAQIKKLSKNKTAPPEPLLNGHQIMKILKLKPGYKIGKIKKQLRDAQLSGKVKDEKEAREFIKNMNK